MCRQDIPPENRECVCQTEAPLRGLLHIVILNLIKNKSAHGGEISKTLKEKFGIDAPRGIIYALLRKMDKDSLIVSNWDIQESGPAKRMYRITEDGLEYLETALERLRRATNLIKILLEQQT